MFIKNGVDHFLSKIKTWRKKLSAESKKSLFEQFSENVKI